MKKSKSVEAEPVEEANKPNVTNTPSYLKGVAAFQEGKPNSENPYPSGSHDGHVGMNPERYNWYMGWYDAKFKTIIG